LSEDGIPELPSVVVVGGMLDGHEVKLNPGLTLIVGAGRLANLRLDHPDIELAHVKIRWDELGLSMIDNGSRRGTWVNGEPVETAGLLDGDVISFVPPDYKGPPAPKIKLRIPKGSVPEPPPLPPGEAAAARPAGAPSAPRPAARARGPARRRQSGFRMPEIDPRLLVLAAGGALLLLLAFWLVKHFLFTVPSLAAVKPAQAEMGQLVTLTGSRFSSDPAGNKVWFGGIAVPPAGGSSGQLEVRVPVLPASGRVAVSVETRAGRSGSVSFTALLPLRVTSVDPPGALPGDEVALVGNGFSEGLTLSVGGQAASVLKVEPGSVRFQMPRLDAALGSRQMVIVTAGGRSSAPVPVFLGRLPLVTAVEPARGVAGDLVHVRGAGFTAGSSVAFGAAPALVVAGSSTELLVVVPAASGTQAELQLPVVVQTGGKASGDGVRFTQQRLVEGAWLLRFLAGAVGDGGSAGQATVGTELAPVMLLSWKGASRSVGERALTVAKDLNAAVDRTRVGQRVSFEAREQPQPCVGIAGAPDVIANVFPQDVAAYETPPGLPSRGAPPTAIALARHWAALLSDTLAIGTSGAKPSATAEMGPPAAPAFAQLRVALPWQYGVGVPSARVAAVPADLRQRLREAAFRVP
jgi:hypothetical protein